MFTTADLFGKFHSPRQPFQAAKAQLPSSPNELANFFQHPFPAHWLSPTEEGPNCRERIYSLRRTFWTFLWQVLNPGSPCTSAVGKLIAWFASLGRRGVHPDTSPYCKARARLPKATLLDILQATAQRAEQGIRAFWRFHDRDVKVADGTARGGVNMRFFRQFENVGSAGPSRQKGDRVLACRRCGTWRLYRGASI